MRLFCDFMVFVFILVLVPVLITFQCYQCGIGLPIYETNALVGL